MKSLDELLSVELLRKAMGDYRPERAPDLQLVYVLPSGHLVPKPSKEVPCARYQAAE